MQPKQQKNSNFLSYDLAMLEHRDDNQLRPQVWAFLQDIVGVCKKHGLVLSEDGDQLVIRAYEGDSDRDWIEDAKDLSR